MATLDDVLGYFFGMLLTNPYHYWWHVGGVYGAYKGAIWWTKGDMSSEGPFFGWLAKTIVVSCLGYIGPTVGLMLLIREVCKISDKGDTL